MASKARGEFHKGSYHFCAGISNNGLDILQVFMVILSLTGLIITIVMTYHSCHEISKLQKLNPILKILYYAS